MHLWVYLSAIPFWGGVSVCVRVFRHRWRRRSRGVGFSSGRASPAGTTTQWCAGDAGFTGMADGTNDRRQGIL